MKGIRSIKFTAWLLLIFMLASTFTACSTQKASQTGDTSAATTKEGAGSTQPAATKDTGGKVTLTVVVQNNVESFLPGQDENNNAIIDYLEKGSGFDLNWVILPKDQPNEKLNMMLAAGEDLDI